MRSVVFAAFLFTCFIGAPGLAAAQDPETPPPPPPPPAAQRAVPREQIRVREPESRPQESRPQETRTRERESRAPERQAERPQPAPDGAARRRPDATRDANRASEETSRTRVPVSATPASNASADDDQGARRRGEVRRPPAGSGGDGATRTGRAVPRSEAPRPPRDTRTVYVYPDYYRYYNRYYDPWGYGGYGLGYFYYSPWAWDPGYYGSYGYGRPRYSAYGYDLGSLRLKVKPRDAEVYVDGYYAGEVDDFDGIFQSLKLADGGYRIEIRKPGFETLHFDVRVQPDRTLTFRGELKPIP